MPNVIVEWSGTTKNWLLFTSSSTGSLGWRSLCIEREGTTNGWLDLPAQRAYLQADRNSDGARKCSCAPRARRKMSLKGAGFLASNNSTRPFSLRNTTSTKLLLFLSCRLDVEKILLSRKWEKKEFTSYISPPKQLTFIKWNQSGN